MSNLDRIMFYTLYRPALSRFVLLLPLPKKMKRDFLLWQTRGMISLAMRKIEVDMIKARREMKA